MKSAYNRQLGKTVLVTSAGLTLYHNATESKGHVRCTGGCTSAWPPLLLPAGGHPTAGAGVSQAKLGTMRRPDGKTQVAYGGMALYRFGSDTRAGDARGQGVGGIWFAVAATSPATTSTPTDTGYGY